MKGSPERWALFIGGIVLCLGVQGLAQEATQPKSTATTYSSATITVPEGEALVLELRDPLNTRTTRKGDSANLTVTTDIFAESQIVIPRGSTVRATVTKARRAGRIFGKALIRLQFDQLTLPDGTSYPISTQLTPSGWWEPTGDMKSQGEGSKTRDLKRIGSGAAQGALIGAIFGGGRGATRGAAAGAAAGTVAVMLERGPELDLPPGMMFEVQLTKPLILCGITAQTKMGQKRRTCCPQNHPPDLPIRAPGPRLPLRQRPGRTPRLLRPFLSLPPTPLRLPHCHA